MHKLHHWRRFVGIGLIALFATLPGATSSTLAQDSKETVKPAEAAKPVFRRRLPNYFAQVVDAKQRSTIYKIQKDYFDKIAALQAQLIAIIAERDQKINAVLTPEQSEKVEQLKADAKAKRAKKAAEKAAEQKPDAEGAAD